jgi:hypothetical protein
MNSPHAKIHVEQAKQGRISNSNCIGHGMSKGTGGRTGGQRFTKDE